MMYALLIAAALPSGMACDGHIDSDGTCMGKLVDYCDLYKHSDGSCMNHGVDQYWTPEKSLPGSHQQPVREDKPLTIADIDRLMKYSHYHCRALVDAGASGDGFERVLTGLGYTPTERELMFGYCGMYVRGIYRGETGTDIPSTTN
jgi:hypothetical protein